MVLWPLVRFHPPLPIFWGPPPQVTVLFAGQHIAKSPFEVQVGRAAGDAGRVSAQGPGIEPLGNVANKSTYFEIFTAGAPRGGDSGWGGGVAGRLEGFWGGVSLPPW